MPHGSRTYTFSQCILSCAAVLLAATAFAQDSPKPPAEAAFLSSIMTVADNWVLDYLTYEEMVFPAMNSEDHPIKHGRHWRLWGELDDAHKGPNSWNYVKAAFLRNGWTVLKDEQEDGGVSGIVHYTRNGVEGWATVDIRDTRVEVQMIEVAPVPVTLTPAGTSGETGNNGSSNRRFPISRSDTWLDLSRRISGPRSVWGIAKRRRERNDCDRLRTAQLSPPPISNALFLAVYRPALLKAGWEILNESNGGDATLLGHYTKNGRNIWAYLHNDASGYLIEVADVGAADLGGDLQKSCHVALYGVLFEFNKSTLQAASDPELQKVADLFAKDPALKLEVQGHTDNVGSDDYNQTLSEARARSVMAWLTQHGVAVARLSAKGYGKTRPVETNDTDEGRAKNRRVEVANPTCSQAK